MGEISYAPLIEDMVWSYSRIKAFDDCPYRWYLKYIRHLHGKDMFFSDYGSFVHKLIELYFLGEKTRDELCDIYLREFKSRVKDELQTPRFLGTTSRVVSTTSETSHHFPTIWLPLRNVLTSA